MSRFYGKYRGTVQDNIDPLSLGRIQIRAPAVLGDTTVAWAMPCVPYAGSGVGLFLIPPNGANVWVEFEGGDPDLPIWSGCFWGSGEVPALAAKPEIKMLRTDGVAITIDDRPGGGGLTIEVSPPLVGTPVKLACDGTGTEISNGAGASVRLIGPSVSINNGALEVT
ncbi:MAG: baseplate assembly protein [Chloroflexi bacterium]|nr:baseplate assembly protein [Chloroflexota bacterium]